jgi:hypothetical protein
MILKLRSGHNRAIYLYDIAKWIAECYFVSLLWNYFPNLASLLSATFRNFGAQILDVWISYAQIGNP